MSGSDADEELYDDADRDGDDDDSWIGFTDEDCGRWWNGKLTKSCQLAGTEDCDFECPLRGSLYA